MAAIRKVLQRQRDETDRPRDVHGSRHGGKSKPCLSTLIRAFSGTLSTPPCGNMSMNGTSIYIEVGFHMYR